MRPQRPAAVVTIAVLNFVFGGLGILSFLCLGLLAALFFSLSSGNPSGPGDPFAVVTDMFSHVPYFMEYTLITGTLGTIMAIVLIASGFGLLNLRPWARTACFIYAGYSIIQTIVGLVYNITIANPAMAEWQRTHVRGGAGMSGNEAMSGVSSVFGAMLGMAYAVAILIVLTRPHVVAAFSGQSDSGMDRGSRELDAHDRPDEPNENIRLGRDDWNR